MGIFSFITDPSNQSLKADRQAADIARQKAEQELRAKEQAAEAERLRKEQEAEIQRRQRQLEADIKQADEERAARLKKEQDDRDEAAKVAQREYEDAQAALAKQNHEEKVAFYENKIEVVKAKLEQEVIPALTQAKKMDAELQEKMAANLKAIARNPQVADEKFKQLKLECQLDALQREKDKGEKEIMDTIAKTGQQRGNVLKFLNLANNMPAATMVTTAKANTLETQIETFGTLISRQCRTQLLISTYFEREAECLKCFIPALEKAGFRKMTSLECDDEKAFEGVKELLEKAAQELSANEAKDANEAETGTEDANADQKDDAATKSPEELLTAYGLKKYWAKFEEDGWDDPETWKDITDEDLTEMGFKKGHMAKFKKLLNKESPDGDAGLSPLQLQTLRTICLKPQKWQALELEQEQVAKKSLGAVSNVMGIFFNKIYLGLKQADELLGIQQGDALSGAQRRAIEAPGGGDEKADEIPSDEKAQFDDDELAVRNAWSDNSRCEVYSTDHQRWLQGRVVSVEDEELQVKDATGATMRLSRMSMRIRECDEREPELQLTAADLSIEKQNEMLLSCAVTALQVTEQLEDEFALSTQATSAKNIASVVQECCVGIVYARAAMRQSLQMVKSILDLKPGNLDAEAEKLWKAMGDGCLHIMTNALEMSKVADKYFSFFKKFQQSFQFYLENSENSLTISTQHLIADCEAFGKFSSEYTGFMKQLNKSANTVLKQCVEDVVGAENFRMAQETREKNRENYLAALKKYDSLKADWNAKFGIDKLSKDQIDLAGQQAEQAAKVDYLTKDQTRYNAQHEDFVQRLSALQSQGK